MASRGASIAWCSQYEHEEEIIFAPCTGLEVQSTRVEGGVLVVTASLSVPHGIPTIEQTISKRKRIVEEMSRVTTALPSSGRSVSGTE